MFNFLDGLPGQQIYTDERHIFLYKTLTNVEFEFTVDIFPSIYFYESYNCNKNIGTL